MNAELGPTLRVAVLSPISWRTPPRHYGPWELFSSMLAEGLVRLGHNVTLFATQDSVTTGRLVATSPTGWSEDRSIDCKVAECLHIASAFDRANEFDIIHNSFDFLPLTYAERVSVPVLTTIHGFSSESIVPVYQRYNKTTSYVAISTANRHPKLQYAATIHHGIEAELFPFIPSADREGYLLFFGRIHPEKGTAEAIDVAQDTGRSLIIAGIVQDQQYFDEKVRPRVDGTRVQFVGAVGGLERARLLGGATALLHLISFDEPFGFSVVEAMMCGTPVIAFGRGSMPELINEHTGVLVADTAGAVAAVEHAASMDRQAIRTDANSRFDVSLMVKRYVDVYRRILAG